LKTSTKYFIDDVRGGEGNKARTFCALLMNFRWWPSSF